jgi:hypothetical protein
MPAIDVNIIRGSRWLAVARARPIRIIPTGYPGAVYKGRVYAVKGYAAAEFAIDVAQQSWSEDTSVCPFASNEQALKLLRRCRGSGWRHLADNRQSQVPDTGSATNTSISETDRHETEPFAEILSLLSIAPAGKIAN